MAAAQTQEVAGISRREFLYYIWGASIALFTGEALALIIWFAIPRIPEGEFGGTIEVAAENLPDVNAAPVDNAQGRFWLVNLSSAPDQANNRMYPVENEGAENTISGVAALYKVCTHLGCIYSWNAASNRFECPCHGSKYRLDGRRIEDPAPRNLDRFSVSIELASGETIESSTDENGQVQPVVLSAGDEVAAIYVDTGDRNDGLAQPLISELSP